ncbi:MAG: hypothetical protein C4327_12680 [Meiothermus sp.]
MKYIPLVLFFSLFTACGPGLNPNQKMANDPPGDATGENGTKWDLLGVTAERRSEALVLKLSFAQEVKLPTPGSSADAGQLTAYIALDADQNVSTDDPDLRAILAPLASYCSSLTPSSLGVEYLIELFERNHDGGYTVLGKGAEQAGEATPQFKGNTLTLRIPWSTLGNPQAVSLGMVVGNGQESTDCFPNQGVFALP